MQEKVEIGALSLTVGDLLGWALFLALFALSIWTSQDAVRQARLAFGVMGSPGPGRWVIRGLETLAAMITTVALTVFLLRVLSYFLHVEAPIWARTLLFFIFMGLIPVGFKLVSYGFKHSSIDTIRLRKHWLANQGFYFPPRKDKDKDKDE